MDDGLNAFHCSFRGSTLSLPAPPLQVTPPRKKSVAIHPVIPLSLPTSLSLLPLTPLHRHLPTHRYPGPPTALTPAAHRAVYQPLRSTHTHRHSASICCQGNTAGEWASPEKSFTCQFTLHSQLHTNIMQSICSSCINEQLAKYVLFIFYRFLIVSD